MQRLVSPELRVYTVSDREALSELVTELRLDSTLAGNLRQLLGYRTVGPVHRARWPRYLNLLCSYYYSCTLTFNYYII